MSGSRIFPIPVRCVPPACSLLWRVAAVWIISTGTSTLAESPASPASDSSKEATKSATPSNLVDSTKILAKIDLLTRRLGNHPVSSDPSGLTRFARDMEDKASEMETDAGKIQRKARELKSLAGEKKRKLAELENSDRHSGYETVKKEIESLDRSIYQTVSELNGLDPGQKALSKARGLVAIALDDEIPPVGLGAAEPIDAIVSAAGRWQREMLQKDPNFSGMIESVSGRIREIIAAEGMPTSSEKAVEMANRAYLEMKSASRKP